MQLSSQWKKKASEGIFSLILTPVRREKFHVLFDLINQGKWETRRPEPEEELASNVQWTPFLVGWEAMSQRGNWKALICLLKGEEGKERLNRRKF
jgi:hypothetical protein